MKPITKIRYDCAGALWNVNAKPIDDIIDPHITYLGIRSLMIRNPEEILWRDLGNSIWNELDTVLTGGSYGWLLAEPLPKGAIQ